MVQRNIFQFTPPLDLTLDLLQARSLALILPELLTIMLTIARHGGTYNSSNGDRAGSIEL
jgi:hypothetical protein